MPRQPRRPEPTDDDADGTRGRLVRDVSQRRGDTGLHAADPMRAGIEKLKARTRAERALYRAGAECRHGGERPGAGAHEARARVTLVRTEIHTSNPAAVEPIVTEALGIVDGVHRAGQAAEAELRFRRRGLSPRSARSFSWWSGSP